MCLGPEEGVEEEMRVRPAGDRMDVAFSGIIVCKRRLMNNEKRVVPKSMTPIRLCSSR